MSQAVGRWVRRVARSEVRVPWGPVALMVVAVTFGCVLRWWRLSARSLWFDEGYTAWVVSLPAGRIIDAIRVDTAPPLYYLLLRGWVRLFGTGEAALRVPSAMCATAALGVMAAVVRRLFADRWARAVAVALVACSFMQVVYAHEARFYSLVGLLGAVDLYVVIRACDGERRSVGWLAAAGVAAAVSLWLNNIMLVYLPCLGLAWTAMPGRRPLGGRSVDVTVAATAAGMMFAPWVPSLLGQMQAVGANFWSHPPSATDLTNVLSSVAGVTGPVGQCAAVALLIAAVTTLVNGRWRRFTALAAYGLLPVLLTFVYSQVRTSIFMDRAFIVSSLTVAPTGGNSVRSGGAGPAGIRGRGRRAVAGGVDGIGRHESVPDAGPRGGLADRLPVCRSSGGGGGWSSSTPMRGSCSSTTTRGAATTRRRRT